MGDFIANLGLGFATALTLSNLASYVQEIFDITQLSHIFEIYTTEIEALNSYHQSHQSTSV